MLLKTVAAVSLPFPPNTLPPKPRSLKCPGGILVAKVDKKDKVGSYELPVLYQKDEH